MLLLCDKITYINRYNLFADYLASFRPHNVIHIYVLRQVISLTSLMRPGNIIIIFSQII
jgi:hypothetical protein